MKLMNIFDLIFQLKTVDYANNDSQSFTLYFLIDSLYFTDLDVRKTQNYLAEIIAGTIAQLFKRNSFGLFYL